MAAAAFKRAMFALKGVSGLLVVERLCIPLDERKVFPIVIRVATHAFLAGSRLQVVRSMQTFPADQSRCDLSVAVETSKSCFTCRQFVAAGTVRRAVERCMRPGEWSGRNLGLASCREKESNHGEDDEAERP